eukprot:scaffold80047_cov16-Prasinocladus_malaysianus.AAC.1
MHERHCGIAVEVKHEDKARMNGNVVLSMGGDVTGVSPRSTVSSRASSISSDPRYTVQQVMVDDMESIK